MDDSNPYQPPPTSSAVSSVSAQGPSDHVSWTWRRVALSAMAFIVHSYFVAMLATWSIRAIAGSRGLKSTREYGMFIAVTCCVLSSAVMLYGTVRHRSRTAVVAVYLCILFFAAAVGIDLIW